MLGKIVRVLTIVAVAASLASPVAAHLYKRKQLDTQLIDLKGEVIGFDRAVRPEEPSYITLLTRNTNHRGEPQPGEDRTWNIAVDTRLMKSAGLTLPTLIEHKEVTIAGYRVADDPCNAKAMACPFAGRRITLEDGCVAFVGRTAPVFGRRATVWGWNVPEDGLENADGSRC